MKNLKRYDVQAKVGRGGHTYTKEIESPTGRYYIADDVEAQEETRKLTREELKDQFEKTFYGFNLLRYKNSGEYYDEDAHKAFYIYEQAAKKNGLLKEGE